MELLHYPGASDTKAYLEEQLRMQQEAQMRQQQQMMQMQAQAQQMEAATAAMQQARTQSAPGGGNIQI